MVSLPHNWKRMNAQNALLRNFEIGNSWRVHSVSDYETFEIHIPDNESYLDDKFVRRERDPRCQLLR